MNFTVAFLRQLRRQEGYLYLPCRKFRFLSQLDGEQYQKLINLTSASSEFNKDLAAFFCTIIFFSISNSTNNLPLIALMGNFPQGSQ